MKQHPFAAGLIAISIVVGLWLLAMALPDAVREYRSFDRTVTVKGLAEQEVEANIVIWPIRFSVAGNEQQAVYQALQNNADKIRAFLLLNGVDEESLTLAPPAMQDRHAQTYGRDRPPFRFSAQQTLTVYSTNVAKVRSAMGQLLELGKQGITLEDSSYRTDYLFTGLNEIKPEMVEQATQNARKVAEKFAADSNSQLGKIKTASQGQFSISSRDKNSPHIKKVRVVSTVVYYLAD
ncbi:SIMPL domain-containing protein [Neiella marina]|uniref:SIMPL domain-containing protein n=1 Tax=Neiella holothuriorum TaxID=2870530 RepID=A0ABS7EL89_9GAMM|nr:SIMPL domain-containing protein [Neiella holothuriorum]MBW8192653.1 SIMPL domain-containing protein [Neiella holothuriorum]